MIFSNILYLLKHLPKKEKRMMLVFFILFIGFPVFTIYRIVTEVVANKSSVIVQGVVKTTRPTFVIFKYAEVSYEVEAKKSYQRVYYFPILEEYRKNEIISLKYSEFFHFVSPDTALYIRIQYYLIVLVLSLILLLMINNALRQKVFRLKLDNGDI